MATAEDQLVASLYDEYGEALYSYALRMLGDRGKAEDVVQEVLLRAWRSPPAADPAYATLRGWLFTVARNVVHDMWRAQKARPPEVPGEEVLPQLPVDDEVARLVETWTVEAALDQLSAHHRAVLEQVFLRGRSVAETAQILGVPAGTVKSRTHHALRNLRTVLERMGMNG